MEIYLDNSATTRVFPEVAELMSEIMCRGYGNPSSLHRKGVEAENTLRCARETLARLLKVEAKEIVFTSGGTESDNLALIGCAMANRRRGNHLITTRIEHPAVQKTMQYLETAGFQVTYLPVDRWGRVSPEEVRRAILPQTILVSVMHTNNEVGSRQPVEEIGALIKRINPAILFHVDAVQGFGKARIYPKRAGIDLLSASGHKIHGPKGVGFLYVDGKTKIQPVLFGGGQQQNLRSGTENVPGAAGLARAAEMLYVHMEEDVGRLYRLKGMFVDGVRKLDGIQVNGLPEGNIEGTAPHIASVSFAGVKSEVLLHALEDKGIYVSAGSACSARKPQPSATLKAMGIGKELLGSTIRFSFSVDTTEEEIRYTLEQLQRIVPMLRRYTAK